ncbi:DUF4350 domain-containing protein [Actinotalea sp. BY-33]|uniref:DUF4350 domain-containing protein n=1 Tax=Actinotalea soli TaxID=2819234 RepID=A0A939LNS0_9CELL|nr:DUF4350 domain-containing protein [Actinotalea soli]
MTSSAAPVVVGDGTTGASRARSRWRRARWPLAVLGLIVVVGSLAAVLQPRTSEVPLAPDNPAGGGARAAAEILGDQGVEVTMVRTSAEALRRAAAGTTLVVTSTFLLDDGQVEALSESEADVVLLDPDWWVLDAVTDGAMDLGWLGTETVRAAECDDPAAQAAGQVRSGGSGVVAVDPAVVVCFPTDEPGTGAYAVLDDGDRRVTVLDDASITTNDRLTEDGNAALVLHTLGRHEQLTWWVPTYGDTSEATTGPAAGELLPAWAGPVAAQLALVVVVLMLWRSRALGRVVTEPLPVTVRAAEATLGRARLYRRSRSRGHAAAALRAGTARRLAARVGLPRTAGAPAVIDALTRATGRSREQVAGLLYGPPPTDDAGLLQLARQLDELESEVHRT